MTIGEAQELYQSYLEGARHWPEDEDMQEDLRKAYDELWVTWLEYAMREEI